MINGSDIYSEENTVTEIQIQDIFVAIDVDSEKFFHFYDQLKTQQTHDSDIPMIEDQGENNEKTDNDENYEEPENLIKDYKTAFCYLDEPQRLPSSVQ